MFDYKAYIRKSQVWRRKRIQIMLRSKGICERCHRWPVVNVHHLSYANVGNESLAELQGVCRKCHQELHNGA